ncbi:MAG: TonB-dependent receptor [Verrucomicrobiota bacterium]
MIKVVFFIFLAIEISKGNHDVESTDRDHNHIYPTYLPDDDLVTALPDITVNAVSELDQDSLPNSSSVISFSHQSSQAIHDLEEIFSSFPNLSNQHAGSRAFNSIFGMRGLVNTVFFSDSPVAIYLDDIPIGQVVTNSSEVPNLSHVIVKRGHQASHYGLNSEAGVLLQYTNEPENFAQATASALYGSYNQQKYSLGISGPAVNEKLFMGFSGFYERRDGYLYNEFLNTDPDSEEGIGGRIHLRWLLNEYLEFSLISQIENFEGGEQRLSGIGLGTQPFTVSKDREGITVINTNMTGFKIKYTGDYYELLSVTSYRSWDLDPYLVNLTFLPAPAVLQAIDNHQQVWSQELRLSSVGDFKTDLMWSSGLFYSNEDAKWNLARNLTGPGLMDRALNDLESDIYAIFGNISIPIRNDLRMLGGIRLDYRQKELSSHVTTFSGIGAPFHRKGDFINYAPNIGMAYDYDDTLMFYSNLSYNFKAGGFVPFQGSTISTDYASERVLMTDIGFKKSFLENEVLMNGALFYSRVWDYQFERFISSVDYTIINADQVEIWGGEFELTATPIKDLEIGAGLGYSWAVFASHSDAITGASLDNKRVPFVPEYNINLYAEYKHPTGFIGRIDGKFLGSTYYDEMNTELFRQADYGLMDIRVGYESDHWGIYFYGKNITDTLYYGYKQPASNAGTPGAPQTFGIEGKIWY